MNDVEALVKKELDSANSQFPLFRSPHEGFAVILEEIDECTEDVQALQTIMFSNVWSGIKANADVAESVLRLRSKAKNLATETIQVAAMCDKYIESRETWRSTVE